MASLVTIQLRPDFRRSPSAIRAARWPAPEAAERTSPLSRFHSSAASNVVNTRRSGFMGRQTAAAQKFTACEKSFAFRIQRGHHRSVRSSQNSAVRIKFFFPYIEKSALPQNGSRLCRLSQKIALIGLKSFRAFHIRQNSRHDMPPFPYYTNSPLEEIFLPFIMK